MSRLYNNMLIFLKVCYKIVHKYVEEKRIDMSYLFDIHVHTKESSCCGEVPAAQVVERYKKLGYDGICVTDHMNLHNIRKHGSTYEEGARVYLSGYRAAKAAAGDSFKVLLGMEIRFLDYDNDYLVFGFDEDFIFTRNFAEFSELEEFRPFALENHLTVFQAHPFRNNIAVVSPSLLDGMEVYNGHGGHDSRNDIAYRWAEKYGLRMSSASDFHRETGMEPGGIYLDRMPGDSADLAKMLLNKEYKLKTFVK